MTRLIDIDLWDTGLSMADSAHFHLWEEGLERLKKLNLNDNAIGGRIPEVKVMESVYADNAGVQVLPASLPEGSPLLKMLSFRHNMLTSIPDSFAQLSNLQKLSLDNNRISAVPTSLFVTNVTVGKIQKGGARTLLLQNNRLKEVPPSVHPGVVLCLHGNPFCNNSKQNTIPDTLNPCSSECPWPLGRDSGN